MLLGLSVKRLDLGRNLTNFINKVSKQELNLFQVITRNAEEDSNSSVIQLEFVLYELQKLYI